MAEGNIYIDLTEEIQGDLKSRYQSLCDELGERFRVMRGALEEICIRTAYEPMVNVVNETIRMFDEDIHQISERTFQEWLDGGGCFHAVVEHSQAGEEALSTANQMETELHDIFENFWGSKPLGEMIQVDTGKPLIKSEDFDALKDVYQRHSQEAEDIGGQSISQITELGEDNPTYHVVIPIVKGLAEPVKNAFEKFTEKIEKAKEDSGVLQAEQKTKNQEAADAATNTSASAQDVAESLEMYRDI